MQKVQPAKNKMDMDFLNSFDTTVSDSQKTETIKTEKTTEVKPETIIDPISMDISSASSIEQDDEDITDMKNQKKAQLLIRVSEEERNSMKAYFMKHGLSVTKGIKLAVKYLEQQEKKGSVKFSDIGIID